MLLSRSGLPRLTRRTLRRAVRLTRSLILLMLRRWLRRMRNIRVLARPERCSHAESYRQHHRELSVVAHL